MTRGEKAIALHKAGSACSQAVFTALAGDLGMDVKEAHRLAGGFGGGIGRMGYTCGAVTGGIMALSLALGASESSDQEKKVALYEIVKDYIESLRSFKGSVVCRELLEGADMWTQEGRDAVKAKNFSETVCNPMIARAVEEAEKILREKGALGD